MHGRGTGDQPATDARIAHLIKLLVCVLSCLARVLENLGSGRSRDDAVERRSSMRDCTRGRVRRPGRSWCGREARWCVGAGRRLGAVRAQRRGAGVGWGLHHADAETRGQEEKLAWENTGRGRSWQRTRGGACARSDAGAAMKPGVGRGGRAPVTGTGGEVVDEEELRQQVDDADMRWC